jgi:hypothetical protein
MLVSRLVPRTGGGSRLDGQLGDATGGKAWVATRDGERDLRAVRLVADRGDGPGLSRDRLLEALGGRAWGEAVVHAKLGCRRRCDRYRRLSCPQERARKDDVGRSRVGRESSSEYTRFLLSPLAERAQLVGLAGIRMCVTDEEHEHRSSIAPCTRTPRG